MLWRMMMLRSRFELSSFRKKIRDHSADIEKRTERLADLIAREVVNHAKSLTSETKPGVNPGDGPRRTHPGNWADVTSRLANSIQSKVERHGGWVVGVVEAASEYAEALNEKEGYEVLGGFDRVARRALLKYQHTIFK